MSASDSGSTGLRERKKVQTRLAIRREAFRLFEEQGYAETTIEQIAVYNRFEDIANEFAGFCAATMETLAQPVPFPYFHALTLLLLLDLLLIS